MLTPGRTKRRGFPGAALVAGLLALPPVDARAVDPGQVSKGAPEDRPPAAAQAAILRGRVTDEAGAPLPDARVRVAIPAIDMRHVDEIRPDRPVRLVEARTDAAGNYRMEIPGLSGRTTVSIDAMKPGYRRLVGTLMAGGDPKSVDVGPGGQAEAALILKPALYFSGLIVDERGRPIPAVEITSKIVRPRSYAFVERTASRPDGSFELFCYPAPPAGPVAAGKGTVTFFRPDYVDAEIEDVYAGPLEGRTALRVVLPTGCKLAGTVLDAVGKPVPKAMVKVTRKDGTHRKATATDENGKFALSGLSPGLTQFSARAVEIRQKLNLPMALNADRTDLEIRLKPILLPADLPRYEVLGMQLTDVTPELKAAYDLFGDRGALILDPGPNPDRLGIGPLAEGDVFWLVGRTRVGSVREFVDRILAETAGQNADVYQVRVVYNFSRVDFDGSRTAQLKLTKEDLQRLQALSDRLAPDPE